MPKKTRKDKIAASIHKQKKIGHNNSVENPNNSNNPKPAVLTTQHTSTMQQLQENTHYFRTDLEKSLWIIFTVLVIELGLYYASVKGLLKFMQI